MGIEYRDYYQDDVQPRGTGQWTESMVLKLIIINSVIFLVDKLGIVHGLARHMMVSAETAKNPLLWWQFLTAGFAHDQQDNMMHILGNMLVLFVLGRDVEGKYGSKKFLAFYITAILLGNIGFSLRSLITNSATPCLGASGGVVATVLVFALSFPQRTLLFLGVIPMPAWVVGAIVVGLDVLGSFSDDSLVAHDVHLIGAAYGYLFFKTGWELTVGMPTKFLGNRKFRRGRPKMRIYNPERKSQQLDAQADAVLEKVHREGQASLSSKERKILEEYSRRMQQKRK